ncbi:hypothetical protein HQN87_06440 [Paenibacillus tritici]|uniref:Uncharacterized protein n=1 Tax=Paenibacillus tritici TaxID=1873425 RepID=A0ABX2DK49_9BACL|nr:hypothetical protein [Paenibacillus tritici]NQX44962.1 hypothetical protein [Paenibacillus tritici]
MDKMKKELVLNLLGVSLVLSLLYSFLIVNVDNQLVTEAPYVSDPGGAVIFVYFFLILYVMHLVISLVGFAVKKSTKSSLFKRLFFFNVIGLIIIGIVYFIVKEGIVFFLIFSLAVYSLISVINHRMD